MSVSYPQTLSTDMIVSEIEFLIEWHGRILRYCFFSDARASEPARRAPSGILEWCKAGIDRGIVDRKIYDRLLLVYDDLHAAADEMMNYAAAGQALTLHLYDSFDARFESLMTQIHRLQQDVSDVAVAIDPVTGLRTASGLRNELKREQDRFDRKGTSFSVACIEVDQVGSIQGQFDRTAQDIIFSGVGRLLSRTTRSFDDAYYIGPGSYVVILKHIEFMDACAVMDRLRKEIEKTSFGFSDGTRHRFTASFGIADAIQKEASEQTLESARAAVQKAKAEGGNRVHEFRETSALERYAKDVKKT